VVDVGRSGIGMREVVRGETRERELGSLVELTGGLSDEGGCPLSVSEVKKNCLR
jgi:hypothetical protein